MPFTTRIKSYIKQYPKLRNFLISIRFANKKGAMRSILHWMCAGHIIKRLRIYKWLNANHNHNLQIGGGYHIIQGNEWLNGDLIAGEVFINATKKLPFPDNSIDVIFTEQFIEHISQSEAIDFLNEAYRVLKTGGIIRQSTPDVEKIAKLYLNRNEIVNLNDVVERHIKNHRKKTPYVKKNGCQFINDMFRLWGHQFIYDKTTLSAVSIEAGFSEIKWFLFGESEHGSLMNLERHADEEWMKNGFVMICEATK